MKGGWEDKNGRKTDLRKVWIMKLPTNKTKIVCTIGPASDSPGVMEQMIQAG